MSGAAAVRIPLEERVILDIQPRGGSTGAAAKAAARKSKRREWRERMKRVAMRAVEDGEEPDDGERWAVDELMDVERPTRRTGRQLSLLIKWRRTTGDWDNSWVDITRVSKDLRAEARRMELLKYGARLATTGGTATRRLSTAQRQERERAAQQARERLRDRNVRGEKRGRGGP